MANVKMSPCYESMLPCCTASIVDVLAPTVTLDLLGKLEIILFL